MSVELHRALQTIGPECLHQKELLHLSDGRLDFRGEVVFAYRTTEPGRPKIGVLQLELLRHVGRCSNQIKICSSSFLQRSILRPDLRYVVDHRAITSGAHEGMMLEDTSDMSGIH